MGPAVDKETVLSKVINNIDVFRINLSHWDEEMKRKYINTILKLDSSKTIMLDTKGPEIRTRNKDEIILKKKAIIEIQYAEFFKHTEDDDILYIDYPNMYRIEAWAIMSIDNDTVKITVKSNEDGVLKGEVTVWGTILINRWVEFENYIPKLPFLSEKDKKQMIRWIDNKINVIAISYIRDAENLKTVRSFLDEHWGNTVKMISKLETKESIENIEEIIEASDGIIINRDKLSVLLDGKDIQETKQRIIELSNRYGKPVIVVTGLDIKGTNNKAINKILIEEMKQWVDSFLLTKETAVAEEPLEFVINLYDMINDPENKAITNYALADVSTNEDNTITDYIIYNAYRASKECDIKAIICPTESGYTPARLSALKPDVPVISFTKNDEAYRYLNLLWGVKGYKISSTFEYANIKQIGKEIIRILFKWSISLDDKILIVHSSLAQNTVWMINWVELYKFKDI